MNSIEDELVGYMDRHAADTPTKARDIQIVAHYYGFDETPWPTLEATAARFGINTRERVRQIIENRFRASATLQNLPHARSAATLLRSRAFWFTSELQAELNALGDPLPPFGEVKVSWRIDGDGHSRSFKVLPTRRKS